METDIIEKSVTADNNDISSSDFDGATDRILRIVSSILRHSELKGKIKTMLLLDKLENTDELLIFSNDHKAAVYNEDRFTSEVAITEIFAVEGYHNNCG